MIDALDHIALSVRSVNEAAPTYETLLGRQAENGVIQLGNMRLALRAAGSDGGLAMLGFAVRDLAKALTLLQRRALPVTSGPDSLAIAPDPTHGVRIALAQHTAAAPTSPLAGSTADAAVSALDHVVIRSPNPERAVALYAGRLGLSLRLDRSEPAWGARLLFFRCGDLIVEIAHDLKAGINDGPDRLWGLSWRVPDIDAAHARLQAAGVEVSGIRTGRRPGTRVLTAKSHASGVPTLLIGGAAG